MTDFRFEEKMSKIRKAGEVAALTPIYQWVKTGAISLGQMKVLVKDVMDARTIWASSPGMSCRKWCLVERCVLL